VKHLIITLSFTFLFLSLPFKSFSSGDNKPGMNVKIDTLSSNHFYYKIFDEQGTLVEEAYWKNGRNVGTFKRYHVNGVIAQEFNFDESGRRVGEQKYYFENGQERLIGNWVDGAINGQVVWFEENGGKMQTVSFRNGKRRTKLVF